MTTNFMHISRRIPFPSLTMFICHSSLRFSDIWAFLPSSCSRTRRFCLQLYFVWLASLLNNHTKIYSTYYANPFEHPYLRPPQALVSQNPTPRASSEKSNYLSRIPLFSFKHAIKPLTTVNTLCPDLRPPSSLQRANKAIMLPLERT